MPKIGMFDRIQQITPTAIRLVAVRQVAERQEQSAAVAHNPVNCQRQGLPAYGKVDFAKTTHPQQAIMLKLHIQDRLLWGWLDRKDEAKSRVISKVPQARKGGLLVR